MSEKRKSRRQSLSAEHIAAVALKHIDIEGLEAFSFRKLGHILRCEAMSIYYYYPSKAHLFDAMVDVCLSEIAIPPPPTPWIERIRIIAHEFRSMALRHSGFFQFFVTHRLNTPAGLHSLNEFMKIFEESGLSAEKRARHFRILSYFISGAALDEALGYAKGPTAAVPVPDEVVVRDFQSLVAVGEYFKPQYHLALFDAGLDVILRNMAEDVARSADHFPDGTV